LLRGQKPWMNENYRKVEFKNFECNMVVSKILNAFLCTTRIIIEILQKSARNSYLIFGILCTFIKDVHAIIEHRKSFIIYYVAEILGFLYFVKNCMYDRRQ